MAILDYRVLWGEVLSYEHTERQRQRKRQRQRQGPLESIVTLQNRSKTHSKRHGKRHHAFQWTLMLTLTLPLPLTLGVFIPLELLVPSMVVHGYLVT